ncbi:unnamed protein product [Rhizophagus irregularis]|nr:unnamed protein product [Rhizophagus irregularis]CAB5298829.1 unnamed protein product [Rhizophagus irregularis]
MEESNVVTHEYFNRKASEWCIIGFLSESNDLTFRQQVNCYVSSLESIANTEEGRRKRKAQQLLDDYRQGSDAGIARDWENEHKLDGPSIIINYNVGTSGTPFNSGPEKNITILLQKCLTNYQNL